MTSSDKLSREFYFPTQFFNRDLSDADEVNRELVELIRAERERDRKGIQRSNFRELGGWHSKNDLHKDPAYKNITDRVLEHGEFVSKELNYNKGYRLTIDAMWSIINGPGSFNRAHIHPGSLWSGVYYVAAPEKCGDIEFIDPRTQNLIKSAQFVPKKKRPREAWTKVRFTPSPGKMIMFPSWLYHSVDPNLSDAEGAGAERIIISFNLSQARG